MKRLVFGLLVVGGLVVLAAAAGAVEGYDYYKNWTRAGIGTTSARAQDARTSSYFHGVWTVSNPSTNTIAITTYRISYPAGVRTVTTQTTVNVSGSISFNDYFVADSVDVQVSVGSGTTQICVRGDKDDWCDVNGQP